jgi:hypothetical protein
VAISAHTPEQRRQPTRSALFGVTSVTPGPSRNGVP